jgi:hypothetical protein
MDKRKMMVLPGVLVRSGPSDTTRPTVAITLSDETTPTLSGTVTATFTFSEAVVGFVVGDITIGGGGSLSSFATADNIVFTATWTFANGANTLDIAEGVCADAAGNTNTAASQKSVTYIQFTLRDEFTTNLAAGAVDGTSAEPTGGTREVIDVESKASIATQKLTLAAQDTPNWGDEGIYYPSVARGAGKMLFMTAVWSAISNSVWGWSTAADVALNSLNIKNTFYTSLGTNLAVSSSLAVAGPSALATGTTYSFCSVLRATGAYMFIKGGVYTNWTLLWVDSTVSTTPLYPAITNYQSVWTVDGIRLPVSTWLPTPLAYDTFTRADGSLGNSETSGPDSQTVAAEAWTAQLGTWGIATNKAASSALDGTESVSVATVDVGTTNVMVEVVATRSAGTSGLTLRYTDADNYIKCVHNGTNLQVIEVVAGTPNTLVNAAATYGAAFRMMVSLNGTKVRGYYNNALIGSEATTAVTTGNNHGLFTDDTGATFDGFLILPKGTGNEYAALDAYINP